MDPILCGTAHAATAILETAIGLNCHRTMSLFSDDIHIQYYKLVAVNFARRGYRITTSV